MAAKKKKQTRSKKKKQQDALDYNAGFDAGVEQLSLRDFTEKAYLDYSMYVILDRALPHVGDGLKPVQRRIIYAMSELGLKASAKFKKSARTVGDVLGKFHPHGDSACYEAMVLMAQPFSYRYTLLEGQGNWGSPDDPKSFAAMRYTESRLSQYADLLLGELGLGTVEWAPNFDGSLDEPVILPAQVPNILMNGTTGIAVGMATDVPPHNLTEVLNATIHLLDNPKAKVTELCKFIKGPDYPTDAEIITPRKDIIAMYKTGGGSIRMRAVYEKDGEDIIVTALPHQASPAKILGQIASQMQAKKLPMVVDLRDESDHENPTRLVIVRKNKEVDVDQLMTHLFSTTDLERTYRVNMNLIDLDGRPGTMNLFDILTNWLSFRIQTVTRRLEYRLGKVNKRLHLLDGLLKAFLNLDEVIRIIRKEDEPKAKLIKRFKLSEIQADYILDTRLRQLARLEEMKIKADQKELRAEGAELEKFLGSKARLKTLIKKELKAVLENYGDKRRCKIVSREAAQAMDESSLISADPITIILSQKGLVRAAKGHEIDAFELNYKAGDACQAFALGTNNQIAVFIDSTGRTYTTMGHTLPSARGQGEPLTGRFTPPPGASFCGVMAGAPEQLFLLATDAGFGFIISLEEMVTKNKKGKSIIKVPEGSTVLPPVPVTDMETNWIVAATNDGNMLIHHIAELPQLPKGKGIKILNIPPAKSKNHLEYLAAVTVINEDDTLSVYSGKRHKVFEAADMEPFEGERAQRGRKLPQGYRNVWRLAPVVEVEVEEE